MRFEKKPETIEAVQWSGINWHQMLDVFGRDSVATNGKDLFLTDRPAHREVPVGHWVVRSPNQLELQVATDEALHATWRPVDSE